MKRDYRKMKPTDKIPMSIDGNEFEVELASLILLRKVIGKTNGKYLLDVFQGLSELDVDEVISDFDVVGVINCLSYENDLLNTYFKQPNGVLEKENQTHLDATHIGNNGNACFYYKSESLKEWYWWNEDGGFWSKCQFNYTDDKDLIKICLK